MVNKNQVVPGGEKQNSCDWLQIREISGVDAGRHVSAYCSWNEHISFN